MVFNDAGVLQRPTDEKWMVEKEIEWTVEMKLAKRQFPFGWWAGQIANYSVCWSAGGGRECHI